MSHALFQSKLFLKLSILLSRVGVLSSQRKQGMNSIGHNLYFYSTLATVLQMRLGNLIKLILELPLQRICVGLHCLEGHITF